jgi:NitT/TauT family transport system substrate-binding protein
MAARILAVAAILLFAVLPGRAADVLRIAVQKTGTVAWEIETMKALGLDREAGLDIQTLELASTEAGKVALRGGAADMIVSDWLWVMRERTLGDRLMFAPYSTALGAVMTPANSPVHKLADLAGRSVGVAGGPLDKSWLMLRAAGLKQGVELEKSARVAYGAPPLLGEKLAQGELDAALEFWPQVVDLEARGFRAAIDMSEVQTMLGVTGPVAMTGYVFSEGFVREHSGALRAYLQAAAKARDALARDPALWAPIKARLRLASDKAIELYRARYLAGVPTRPIADEIVAAQVLYKAIATVEGGDLVGKAATLDPALFFDPAREPDRP